MKRPLSILVFAAALTCAGAASAGSVNVSLVHPERFSDAMDAPDAVYPTASLQGLTAYLRVLGQKYLPPGQTLVVELTDVDLVGKLQLTHRHGFMRVARSPLDWPRIALRYRLEANGQVLKSGEESVSDMNFMGHAGIFGDDPLRYEKRMLGDWFRARFVAR